MINKTYETFEKFFGDWVDDDDSSVVFQEHFYAAFIVPWNRSARRQDYYDLEAELVELAERFGFESVDEVFQALVPREAAHGDTLPDGEPTEPNDSRFPQIAAMPEPTATSTLTRFAEPNLTAEYAELEDALETLDEYREMAIGVESREVQDAVIAAAAVVQRIQKSRT